MTFVDKKFTVKIYDSIGTTLLKTVNPLTVKDPPAFASKINQGFGQCVVRLNLPFDDFDEGVSITHMNIVRIYEIDTLNPGGRLIYAGFISSYQPSIKGGIDVVEVNLLGLVSLLALSFFKNGSNFTVSKTGIDLSQAIKDVIDHFNTVYSGSLIGYDGSGTTIDSVGSNIEYDFVKLSWLDSVKKTFELIPDGWYWTIDQNGQFYLKQTPSTPTHTFTIGKDVDEFSVRNNSENIINQVTFEYTGGAIVMVNDATSISAYGLREKYVTDSEVQDAANATIAANKIKNAGKNTKIEVKLTVNNEYDTESIKVGETCRITNYKGTTLFTENMLIIGVNYTMDNVVLEIGDYIDNFGEEIDKFVNQ